MKRVIFYGILLMAMSTGFTSCEKESYQDNNPTQYAKEEGEDEDNDGEDDEYADYMRGTVSNTSNIVLDNATLTLYFQNNVYDTTSSDIYGSYEFTRVPIGQYVLKAQKTGYVEQSVHITATKGAQIAQDFSLVAE